MGFHVKKIQYMIKVMMGSDRRKKRSLKKTAFEFKTFIYIKRSLWQCTGLVNQFMNQNHCWKTLLLNVT